MPGDPLVGGAFQSEASATGAAGAAAGAVAVAGGAVAAGACAAPPAQPRVASATASIACIDLILSMFVLRRWSMRQRPGSQGGEARPCAGGAGVRVERRQR